jgi:hypothetical protein
MPQPQQCKLLVTDGNQPRLPATATLNSAATPNQPSEDIMTSRQLLLPALLLMSACQGPPETATQTSALFNTRDLVESQPGAFRAYDELNTYFIDASHNLYLDRFAPDNSKLVRQFVEGSVAQVQLGVGQSIWVLDTSGQLTWQATFGSGDKQVIATNVGVFSGTRDGVVYFQHPGDSSLYRAWRGFAGEVVAQDVQTFVGADSQHVYVKEINTGKLWLYSLGTSQSRTFVDGNVLTYAPNDGLIYVRGEDVKLWRETPGAGHGSSPVDAQVNFFQPYDTSFIFVQGSDNNLWREDGDWTHRDLVDGNVLYFQATSLTTVWVEGRDGKLWREHLSAQLP